MKSLPSWWQRLIALNVDKTKVTTRPSSPVTLPKSEVVHFYLIIFGTFLLDNTQKKEEKRKQQEEAYKLDKIYDSLSPEQKQKVDLEIQEKLPFFAKDRIREGAADSPILQASLKLTKEQVIKEWIEAGKIEPLGG